MEATNPIVIAATTALTALLAACGAGPDSDGSDRPAMTDPQASEAVTEPCQGLFDCHLAGQSAVEQVPFVRDARGACVIASIVVLEPDGSAWYDGDYAGTWEWTATGMLWCADPTICYVCQAPPGWTPPSAPDGAGVSSGRTCRGYAQACSSRPDYDCSSQKGCHQQSRVDWQGEIQFDCAGWADSCESFSSAESCARQKGCRWY